MPQSGVRRPMVLLVALGLLFLATDIAAIEMVDKDLLFENEEWKAAYDAFTVDPDALEILQKKAGDTLRIDVYLGTWCSDSQEHVPVFIKIIEALDNPTVEVTYYNIERKESPDVKFYFEEFQIERLPTFVFYRDGEEIGRIVEHPRGTLLEHILKIM